MDHTAELRQLFLMLLDNQDEPVFVPIERITEIIGEWEESGGGYAYDKLDELGDEFEIEEKSSWPTCLGNTVGFYVAPTA